MRRNRIIIIIRRIIIGGILAIILGILGYLFVLPYFMPVRITGRYIPYNYILKDNHVEIYEYTGNEEEVIIPERILFRKVTALCEYTNQKTYEIISSFRRNQTIERVVVPDTVTKISSNTFDGCSNVREVILPPKLKEIGMFTFRSCISLQEIEIPKGVEGIRTSAFKNCVSLTAVEIPDTVTEIGSLAFADCINLETVTIPDTVEKIDADAFDNTPWYEAQTEPFVEAGNRALIKYNGDSEVVEIPEGITYLGHGLGAHMDNAEQIIIPESVKEIGRRTFTEQEKLKRVVLYNDSVIIDKFGIVAAEGETITIVAREGSAGHKYVEEDYGYVEGVVWEELEE